ncbi:MAG: response regulator [Actinobacteria bacterium]|nr:response regulator [Actinomycetota bacterium]
MSRNAHAILVVDDDENIRTIVDLSIRTYGKCEVTLASSGLQAIELVRQREFDLIVLDVMMPDLDGPATLTEIRRGIPNFRTPVAFLTAKAQASDAEYLMALGASNVITKPFDPKGLVEALCRIVEA